ncbi:hypothetical protein [Acetivibrio cellulolyticus]|uniref:hypothetical protein n=1 Tax=Acetivibrio cellulolyticus TaxID=35830 RepID=UPI0001E2E6B4|nr:hypothetical protein [Acetivibrio cellulolyticus]
MGFDQITLGDIIGYILTFVFGFISGGTVVKFSSKINKKTDQSGSIVFGDQTGGDKHGK